jgi:uncharacterized protein YgiM (DUF1202 family)
VERAIYTIVGILSLTLVAGGLTEVSMAFGQSHLAGDYWVRPAVTVTPSPSVSPSPSPTLSPTPVVTPAPTPAPAAATATTVSFVRLRAGASTATAVVAELQGGTVVTLGAYSDSQWQEAYVNGAHGYIFKSYLRY